MANYEYIDLYVVTRNNGDKVLAQAPWLSRIEIGSTVIVENGGLIYDAVVRSRMDISRNEVEDINFIKVLAGYDESSKIPKIIKRIVEHEVKYEYAD